MHKQHIAVSDHSQGFSERDGMNRLFGFLRFLKSVWVLLYGSVVRRCYSDAAVIRRYTATGAEFGHAVSYVFPMGECVGFEDLLDAWSFWEQHLLLRGYRTLPIDDFVQYGGYGMKLPAIEKASPDTLSLSHAEIYRQLFLGKVEPAMDITQMESGKIYTGTGEVPSTRGFCK